MTLSALAFLYVPAFMFWLFVATRLLIAVCNPRLAAKKFVEAAHVLMNLSDAIRASCEAWAAAKERNKAALDEATAMLTAPEFADGKGAGS